ncbi:Uncharacterised protein [Mycolicibacterium vanbaalenii]|uniref:Aminopeptidase n=1 Tax=Mycolicibacterium vanbaalenii TaxID=110539 RepID=A0A5S9P084_MYCVN|nr:hypothetical protein [Mycolicibacterium vanbaalenii]CAA0096552.1 Uncharacterised protein [Mycolicibacterium vanbaalenii]
MKVRLIFVAVGAVALLVGIVGLVVPVSVSAGQGEAVSCGSAIAPDLSAARANDDASEANVPVFGEVLVDPNYVRLCEKDLEDRRLWTITLGAVGALTIVAVLTQGAVSGRAKSSR